MKIRITLKAKKDFGVGSTQKGDFMTLYNDVFDENNGTAFWQIERDKWEVVLVERYTEKKDVDGIEIYEGDRFEYHMKDNFFGVVRFGSYNIFTDDKFAEHIGFYVDWGEKNNKILRTDLGYWANLEPSQLRKNKYDNLLEEIDSFLDKKVNVIEGGSVLHDKIKSVLKD